ncbi:MAG: DinB family protein [Chitinophagales bacterium]|nr:DinB family protein [Chitinophagales bacterium]
MDINPIRNNLSRNRSIFEQLFRTFSDESSRNWKPSEGKWCALEILCHLYDEERFDFRARIRHILNEKEDIPMPGINPEGWVTERKYMAQDYENILGLFLKERTASIIYLDEIKNANWDKEFIHPYLKAVSPSFFLNNWLAHDYLHMRQIIRLKFELLEASSKGIELDYAGTW